MGAGPRIMGLSASNLRPHFNFGCDNGGNNGGTFRGRVSSRGIFLFVVPPLFFISAPIFPVFAPIILNILKMGALISLGRMGFFGFVPPLPPF